MGRCRCGTQWGSEEAFRFRTAGSVQRGREGDGVRIQRADLRGLRGSVPRISSLPTSVRLSRIEDASNNPRHPNFGHRFLWPSGTASPPSVVVPPNHHTIGSSELDVVRPLSVFLTPIMSCISDLP